MNVAERRLITYTAAAHAVVHITELTYPALLTRIGDDFGVRAVILGTIASVFSWAFGGSAIPAGFLTDRLGSRRVLFYAFAGATVSLVLVGLSPNEWVFAATLALLGFCIGLYHPAGLSLMAQGVRQRGLALGFHGVSGNVGQALAPALAVGLAIAVDWRLAFFVLAGVSAVMAALLSITTLPLRGESEVFAGSETPAGSLACWATRRRARRDGRIRDAPGRRGAAKALAQLLPPAAAGVRRLRPQRRRLPWRDHLPSDPPGGLRG